MNDRAADSIEESGRTPESGLKVSTTSLFSGRSFLRAVVAIPACNEQEHVEACLEALDKQVGVEAGHFGVLLFLNNCTDATLDIVSTMAARLAIPFRVLDCHDPSASAGWARRRAMEAAATWLQEAGASGAVLLTSDADSRVPLDWVARNMAAIDDGADAVAGRLHLDPIDAATLPKALRARGALETSYETVVMEISARLSPVPGDPWPRHWCRSGASLAVTLDAYLAVGGMPDVPSGEDNAFVEAVLAQDMVVRHEPGIAVVTSGRLQGRAIGGVADTIRRRCEDEESFCDDRLERLVRIVWRALLERRLRRLHALGHRRSIKRWARFLSIEPGTASRISDMPGYGQILAAFQAASPLLTFRPLRPSALPYEIRRARRALLVLRLFGLGARQPEAPFPPFSHRRGCALVRGAFQLTSLARTAVRTRSRRYSASRR